MRDKTVSLDDISLIYRPLIPYEATHIRLSRRWDPEYDAGRFFRVCAAYKRKADKIQPIDRPNPAGDNPRRMPGWKEKALAECKMLRQPRLDPYGHLITGRMTEMAVGARLTPERIERLKIGQQLGPNERELLMAVLFNREGALAWNFSQLGRIKENIAPPQKINTIEHTPWQAPPFHVPRALEPQVIEILKERLDAGVLEFCHGPYRNPWFLVKKSQKGKYRLINAAMLINKVTIRDANIPPNVEEFAEEFAGLQAVSLVDMQSGYDQVILDKKSRDITGFQTPLGLLRNNTLIQGGTNSVAQFCRIMTQMLEDLIPNMTRVFVDDIGVKGPRSDYNGEEALPGVRRYILEAIQNLDRVLTNIECAGGCISGEKSQFIIKQLKIVGFICGPDGRMPEATKVLKIVEWPPCRNLEEARAFIGICVYFRLWIESFAMIARSIYALFKKNVPFVWGDEQQEAMDELKLRLTSPPAIQSLNYEEGAGEIVLAVDASLQGWGSTLMQAAMDRRRRHVCRYDSGIWSKTEAAYDAGKRECRGVLMALKKVRHYLYGVYFILEVDARTLVAQLNKSAADVPGALLNRWLAWIRLFDFDVRHVPGKKHLAADGLSRRPRTADDDQDNEEDVEEFLDMRLDCVQAYSVQVMATSAAEPDATVLNPDSYYSDEHLQIADYLLSLKKPKGMATREYNKFKKNALRYLVRDGELFRRGGKNTPIRRVVDDLDSRKEILQYQHDLLGHKGVESTYNRVSSVYWWDGLYKDVKAHVSTCDICQRRERAQYKDTIYPTVTRVLFEKVAVDVVKMPKSGSFGYIVVAREDLSGWVEARALKNATSAAVAQFLWEDVITRFGIIGCLVHDGGPENKKWVTDLMALYGIPRILTSAYNPAANGMVERGHLPIIDCLSKLSRGGYGKWKDLLHLVKWADRTTIRQSTGKSAFELMMGWKCVLPIEAKVTTWNTLPWSTVRTRADLLAMRSLQLLRRDEDLEEAVAHLERKRREGKEYQDDRTNAIDRGYKKGDLVLLHDSRYKEDNSASRKLSFWWLGPYRVVEANTKKGNYRLAELDGSEMEGTITGRRLKPYKERAATDAPQLLPDSDISESDESSDSSASENEETTIPVPIRHRRQHVSDDEEAYEEGSQSSSDSD